MLLAPARPALAAGDSKAPHLGSVTVMEHIREDNDLKYMIRVEANDDISGIKHITVQLKNLSNDRMVSKVLRAEDGIDGAYFGWLKINAYEKDGTFTLYKVTITDYAGNYQVYCRSQDIDSDSKVDEDKLKLPNSADITLNNGIKTLDEYAPELISISVAPEMAITKTEIRIAAQVTDKGGSGIDYVKVRFVNLNGHGITINLNPENGHFTGTISEIQTKHAGNYVLDRVMLKDNAGNRAVYLPGSGVLEHGLQFVITEKDANTSEAPDILQNMDSGTFEIPDVSQEE